MLNPYKRLLAIQSDRPLLVGTVTIFGGGVATIQLPGGGLLRARGTATVGQKVFFRDGVIEGVAPDLPVEVIDV